MTGPFDPIGRASDFLFRCPALVTGVTNDAGTTDILSSDNCMTTVDWYDNFPRTGRLASAPEKSVAICLNPPIGLASKGAMG